MRTDDPLLPLARQSAREYLAFATPADMPRDDLTERRHAREIEIAALRLVQCWREALTQQETLIDLITP